MFSSPQENIIVNYSCSYCCCESGEDTLYSVFTDHLGSWKTVVNETDGQIYRQSFDAWGRKRSPQNWNSSVCSDFPFDRGYTGHQHLDEFGLINMNGRMYDVGLCRFLSPDPYVQAPDFTQNFNRYSYCLNNPLVYTDPSGEFVITGTILIGVGIGAAVGYFSGRAAGLDGMELAAYTVGAGVIGGFTAGIGSAVSASVAGAVTAGGFTGGLISGAAGGAASGFIGGAFGTALNNTAFGQQDNILLAGLKGAGWGALAGGLASGISRGISDYRNGYNFWDGSAFDEIVVQGEASKIALNYNSSTQAEWNDEYLKQRMVDQYSVQEGDYGIKQITTKTSRGYGMNTSGKYVNLKTKAIVGGYVKRFSSGCSQLHVSAHYTNADVIAFKAVAGHELIHSYHHFTIPGFNKIFSERVAYKYTHDTYANAKQWNKAIGVYLTAYPRGYIGSYPIQYQIPTPLGW